LFAAPRTERLPLPVLQKLGRSQAWRHHATIHAEIIALTVYRHRRGQDQLLYTAPAMEQFLQQDSGALRIGAHVACDLIHRLADTNGSRQMKDDLYSLQGAMDRRHVLYVAPHQFSSLREIAGKGRSVHLRSEVIQNSNLVPGSQQRIHEMRPHKTCSPGY